MIFSLIHEDHDKSFVKSDFNRAQYLNYNLELIQGSFREFNDKYRVLKSGRKMNINTLSVDEDRGNFNPVLLRFYNFLLMMESALKYAAWFAFGLSIGLYFENNEQLFYQISLVTLVLVVCDLAIVFVRKRIED